MRFCLFAIFVNAFVLSALAEEMATPESRCVGEDLTSQEFFSRFRPGASQTEVLGVGQVDVRSRRCNDYTGCTEWGPYVEFGSYHKLNSIEDKTMEALARKFSVSFLFDHKGTKVVRLHFVRNNLFVDLNPDQPVLEFYGENSFRFPFDAVWGPFIYLKNPDSQNLTYPIFSGILRDHCLWAKAVTTEKIGEIFHDEFEITMFAEF